MRVRRRLFRFGRSTRMLLLGLAFLLATPDSSCAQSSGGWIGLKIAPLRPESASARDFDGVHGVLVMAAVPGGPAAAAGLRSGDIVTVVDGRRVAWHETLVAVIRSRTPGQTIPVVYQRNGRERQTSVTLGRRETGLQSDLTEEQAAADYNAAYEAFEAGNAREALPLLQNLVEHGSPAARALLGYLYDSGTGVPKNRTEAHRLYRLAAENGNIWAQYSLGLQYRDGVGGPRDLQRAYYWLEKAAQEEYPDAVSARDALKSELSGAQRAGAEAWLAYVPKEPDPGEIAALEQPATASSANEPANVPMTGAGAAGAQPLSSEDVREIQRLLASLGYAPGPADGAAGPRTRRAIEAFQADRGLPVDGLPALALLKSLRAAAPAAPATAASGGSDLGNLDDLSDF